MLCHSTSHGPEILPPIDAGQGNREFAVAAAGVLHDLGNLIQIASSALNILARTPEMAGTHREPILHRARTSLDHAGTIVRQCVVHARDTAEAPPRSDIAGCLADIAALILADEEPSVALDIALPGDLPDIACDPIGLRRAVLNLVFNARDAMGGKGRVRIEARAVAGSVDLRVGDHGIGMPPATLARVFDPFFTTKRDGLGGIGLPMVERFVRGAGGNVSIESEPGIGTLVTLRLPALPQETRS
ncbi:ATP-binding protein [Sphingomonas sp. R-74633]|uniref:sensor histidine kinase n=1 Tax=Sphingomonas sp. R-74633 TaxID=2751188 RepID=UPI0015D4645C|nr:ATP-binding protein [Sphingomonas sp. R-74633]NYT41451.1 ATP-binding protein [Sphingomonas sp. R-74633]